MKKIDFLSEFPRVYIFQEEENKTNFGGVLFLIYGLIMLFISLSYILDFYLNDKFVVEYVSIINQTDDSGIRALDANPYYNPIMEFKLSVVGIYSDNFKIILNNNFDEVKNLTLDYGHYGYELSYSINSSVTGFRAYLSYFCGNDSSCIINKEKDSINEKTTFLFNFQTSFPRIAHQNSLKPILDDYGDKIDYGFGLFVDFKNYVLRILNWKVIKYIEKKGISRIFDKLFDRKTEYITGYYDSQKLERADSWTTEINGSYYKILMGIYIENPHEVYDEYKRKRITELDVLSTISALFSPIRLVFLFIYRFYSKNFNNYKIIENILNQKYKKNKLIELKEFSEKKDSPIKDLNDNEKQEILIKSELIEKSEESEDINGIKKEQKESESMPDKNDRILPKYSFGQFFLNNLYCKNCKICNKYKEQQEIINLCNTINMNYLSIDSLLYNQMMLENLFKDYKWNNSLLNNIKNNDLILKLKTLIE